jgi:hypothetical protein
LQETLWAHRILALYRSGRQADALAAYRRVRDVLIAELGVEPGPALNQLHKQILTADPAISLPAVERRPLRPAQLPADLGTFTGRQEESEHLLAAMATSPSGSVLITAIDGMAGIGKTTLAVHAAHRLTPCYADGGSSSICTGLLRA